MIKNLNITPAQDLTASGRGVICTELVFIYGNERGLCTLRVLTNWFLPSCRVGTEIVSGTFDDLYWLKPYPIDFGYHAATPLYSDNQRDNCPVRAEGFCYYTGSQSSAAALFEMLISHGLDAVWTDIERRWRLTFDV